MMEPLSTEWQVQLISESKFRVIRALRAALIVLHDAHNDIAGISPSVIPRPNEVREAQIKAWNTVGRLLMEASKSIKAYQRDYVLADLSHLIKECDDILRLKSEDDRKEMLKPLREQLRKFKNRKREPGT